MNDCDTGGDALTSIRDTLLEGDGGQSEDVRLLIGRQGDRGRVKVLQARIGPPYVCDSLS